MLDTALGIMKGVAAASREEDRSARGAAISQHLQWLRDAALPTYFLSELFPDADMPSPAVSVDVGHHFELPLGERLIVAAIAQIIQPATAFEFGTFTGSTTRLIAEAVPDCKIQTIDLPEGGFEWEPWVAEVIGMAFRDQSFPQITQIRQDSRTFDFRNLAGLFDLVFVDASHAYDDVLADSRNALKIVSSNGVVLWDDYQAGAPDVVRALNSLAQEGVELFRIARSRLVIHRPLGFNMALPPGVPWQSMPKRGRPRP